MKVLRVFVVAITAMAAGLPFAGGPSDKSDGTDVVELTYMVNFGPTEAITASLDETIEIFHSVQSGIKVT